MAFSSRSPPTFWLREGRNRIPDQARALSMPDAWSGRLGSDGLPRAPVPALAKAPRPARPLPRHPAQRREPALHGWGGCGCRAEAHAARGPASHDRDVRPPRARLPAAGDLQAVAPRGGSARRASTARRRRQRVPHGTATARGPGRRSARRRRRDFRTLFGCFRIDSGRTRTCYPRLRRPVLYPDELRSQGTASTTEVSGLPSVSSSLFTAVSEAVLELGRFSVSRSICPPSQSASR